MKYFQIDRLKEAIDHLSHFHSDWVVVPLVLAANGVNTRELVNTGQQPRIGTTPFLNRYFSGALIGLPAFENGHNFLRPKFAELLHSLAGPEDYVVHQRANLWSSSYSSRGYREPRQRGELGGTGSEFQVLPPFLARWREQVPDSFHFEELLVWLYAFQGIPDSVDSWAGLFQDFQSSLGVQFDPVFLERFHVENGVDWPSVFLQERPSDSEFQRELLPSRFAHGSGQDSRALGEMVDSFLADCEEVGLVAEEQFITRLQSSLLAKPFLILTGLAGSGKTILAIAFARWITPDPGWVSAADHGQGKNLNSYYSVVPVGADWTGSENIVGYADSLDVQNYVSTAALELIIHARTEPERPHFLILDEMNLSHVERYFADLLSALESGEAIPLYNGEPRSASGTVVPSRLLLPSNLFVIGTVNVDETTYMFSPKVLDRANVLEFRMREVELREFLADPRTAHIRDLDGRGAPFGQEFALVAGDASASAPETVVEEYQAEMLLLFQALRPHGGEFGYRLAHEAARYLHSYELLAPGIDPEIPWFPAAFDCVIFQKFLPRLHGSRARLGPVLKTLWYLCIQPAGSRPDDAVETARLAAVSSDPTSEPTTDVPEAARYPLSAEKISRMWRVLNDNGFVSFAEA